MPSIDRTPPHPHPNEVEAMASIPSAEFLAEVLADLLTDNDLGGLCALVEDALPSVVSSGYDRLVAAFAASLGREYELRTDDEDREREAAADQRADTSRKLTKEGRA